MKTPSLFILFFWVVGRVVWAQAPHSPSATRPTSATQPAMNGDTPAALPTDTLATDQPTGPTAPRGINPIIPLQQLGGHGATPPATSDWVLVYDLCAQQNRAGSALSLQNGKGDLRSKLYLRHNETVRMVVVGNNPSSGPLSISTQGLVTTYDTTNGLVKLAGVQLPESARSPSPPNASRSPEEQAVAAVQRILDNYRLALEAVRKGPLFQHCITDNDIRAYFDAPVPNSPLQRDDLMQQQQQRLARLPDSSSVKRAALESLNALQAELDRWQNLLATNTVSGALLEATGNDLIQFIASRRSPEGTTLPVLAPLNVPVYGNFRVNVSTGFLFNRLVDYSYLAVDEKVWQQNATATNGSAPTTGSPGSTTGVTRKIPVFDSPGWGSVGVGALAHFYATMRSFFTPAFSIGASLNATGKYTAMAGGSLILGNDQRIVLTAGYALGPVSRLQEPFREGVAYDYTGATFPTTNRTEGNWAFGLTWNLASKRTVKTIPSVP